MFTFRRLTILFFLVLLNLNLWNIFFSRSTGGFIQTHAAVLYFSLFTLYAGISVAMAFLPCSNFHHTVTCHGTTDDKWVSITFDDGPDPVKTPLILEVLKNQEVYATFFFIGKNIEGNELLVKRLSGEGHLIGNHSFSHSGWFDLFSAKRMAAELLKTNQLIENIIGKSPAFFRPPFGVINPMVSKSLQKTRLKAICWDIRSLDTLNKAAEKTSQKILRKLKPGSVILLHDHTKYTGHHLDELLTGIGNAGYRIVPLDKLLKIPAYAV